MARRLLALCTLLAFPGLLLGQADTAGPRPNITFGVPPLQVQLPAALGYPWLGAPAVPLGVTMAAWDSATSAQLAESRAAWATADRLSRIYGRPFEVRTAVAAASDTAPVRRGAFGLNAKYADLAIDGQARVEIRTERVRNERCTAAAFQDINSGCKGSFTPPRLDEEFNVRAGGTIGQRLHLLVDYDPKRDFSGRNNVQVYYEGLEDEVVRRIEVGTVAFRAPPSRFITAAIPSNNFGVNATFEFGALQLQTLAATQKGSVVATRTYTIGQTATEPQDRAVRDLDFESGRFFWVVDPGTVPGYPALDILNLTPDLVPASLRPVQVRVYRYRPASPRNTTNPNLAGITALALRDDSPQRIGPLQWELLIQGVDYYLDPSGLWFVMAGKLDIEDYLAVSYVTAGGTSVGTFPSKDQGLSPSGQARDSIRLIIEPKRGPDVPTFRYEMRQIYRVAGADLDRHSLQVNLSVNRSEKPQSGLETYLAQLGLAVPTDPTTFDADNRLFPRLRDPGAATTIRESYIVFPNLQPFADPTRLTPSERSDSLYRTPLYLLLDQGPPARFNFRLRYNSSSTGDRTTLNLNALQIRDGSERLYVGSRALERGIDYQISYDLGQVTFLNPDKLFPPGSATVVTARFEQRGLFAVAPTSIFGFTSRYSLGERGAINAVGIYQSEQTVFTRPPLGFEASASLIGGLSTELHFKPDGITRLLNGLTSTRSDAPSHLDVNGELALSRPDPNRSGQAVIEDFEGDPGVPISLAENLWEYSSVPQTADGVFDVVGPVFDSTDAVQLIWQNLVPAGNGQAVELHANDIDPRITIAGANAPLETVMFMTFHADTAGGIVDQRSRSHWTLPRRDFRPRWRSIVTSLSSTGLDVTKNELLEFWVFQDFTHSADSAGVKLVVDLGSVNEDALAFAPDSLAVSGADSTYFGRRYVGVGRLDSERSSTTGIFNAATDDIGILGDRPDSIRVNADEVLVKPALCQRVLSQAVPVYPWGDLGSRCTNGNGFLDTEDLNGDRLLNANGPNDNVIRFVFALNDPRYFVRDGVTTTDGQGRKAGWKLYRLPLRAPDAKINQPNLRLVQHLRLTVVAPQDNGQPDVVGRFAVARMRFVGSPWVRRAETPIAGISGATGQPHGAVAVSIVSTENTELGYVSPPGIGNSGTRVDNVGDLGSQINERSLRLVGNGLQQGERAEGYFRFTAGPQNLLKYRELRVWARGYGPGWGGTGDLRAYVKLGSDNRNFYQYMTTAETTTWLPEIRVDLDVWRQLRVQLENAWLSGAPPNGASACGMGDSTAYVACSGPYLVHLADPGINPPNLAAVQEIAAGIYRAGVTSVVSDAELWVDDIRLDQPISRVGTAEALDLHLSAADVGDVSLSYLRQDGQFRQLAQDPTYRTTATIQLSTVWRLDRFLPTSLGIALPLSVTYSRTNVNPELLAGTDLQASALVGLRRPLSNSATYTLSLARSRRGTKWLVRGLVDPFSMSANYSRGRNLTELSNASSRAYAVQANYSLILSRRGPHLDLGGIVKGLPGWLRESEAGQGLRRPQFNLLPSNVRLTSGLTRNDQTLFSYQSPIARLQDSLIRPITSLVNLWRNSAGLTYQPLGMLTLNGDLSSTRDLRHYSDSTSLGRLVNASRRSFLGADVGVERDRQLSTGFNLVPRISSWLRPRFSSGSSFILSRSLTSRPPIRVNGDTAGPFILPQTLNNSRTQELGASVDLGRALDLLVRDSSLGTVFRRIRPLDFSTTRTRTSTYDLAAFDPGLGYMLALGGLDRFLHQDGATALGGSQYYTTSIAFGADLPYGFSMTGNYSLLRTESYQKAVPDFFESITRQVEWPSGSVRWSRTLRHGPFSILSVSTGLRKRAGLTSQPGFSGQSAVSNEISSTSVSPDLQIGLRNGMSVSLGYSSNRQRVGTNGNLTLSNQDNLVGTFGYSFRLPASVSHNRKVVRASLTGVRGMATSCLQRAEEGVCEIVSDVRNLELRGGLDSEILRVMTAGLNFGYSVNDLRQIDRKVSQLFISASFQLYLYAGQTR